ncbi:MAG TPA: hypothetical protein DIT52_02205 [Flavobacteriaceae bacterium]|nr:hypothetical protein [Flavobacteriaceae bacterium]
MQGFTKNNILWTKITMKQNIDYDGMADQGRVPSSETKKISSRAIWGGLFLLLVFVLFILSLTF